jgi:hypothetical protein
MRGCRAVVLLLSVSIAATFSTCPAARADIVAQQEWEGMADGFLSQTASIVTATHFDVPGTATVASATWSGFYPVDAGYPPVPVLGTSLPFEIRLHSDAATPPSNATTMQTTPALPPFFSATVNATVTNVQAVPFPFLNNTAYKVDFASSLPSPAALVVAGRYWLGIQSTASAEDFYWTKGHAGGDLVYRTDGSSFWIENTASDRADVVFALNGTVVPEPSAIVLAWPAMWFAAPRRRSRPWPTSS